MREISLMGKACVNLSQVTDPRIPGTLVGMPFYLSLPIDFPQEFYEINRITYL